MAGLKDINLKELDNLSEEERKAVLEILKQYSTNGSSEIYDELKYSDWTEIPVDINTFIHDKRYLGNALYDNEGKFTLYPYWEEKLKDIFPDNITTRYNTIILTGAIGLGKSTVAVICQLYLLYRLLCLKDPYLHYGMQPIDKITISLMNITIENAKGVALDKMNQMILSSEWFMAHGQMVGSTKLKYKPEKHIELIVASGNNQVIGRALFCLDGNTVIKTYNGDYTLKDLVNKEVNVMSLDNNKNFVFSNSCKIVPTIKSSVEYQIELEDGSIIKCTPNHKFMLKDGSYKEAQYLTEQDELFDVYSITYNEFIQHIIDTRGQWAIPNGEYFEAHHIIPRCLGGDGMIRKKGKLTHHPNIIYLYAYEHFIAHKLLAREHPENKKLLYAWSMMAFPKSKNQKLNRGNGISEWEYDEIRRKQSALLKEKNTLLKNGKPWNYGLTKETDERVRLASENAKGRPSSAKGVKKSDEFKKHISEVTKQRYKEHPETFKGSTKGKVAITNGVKCIYIDKCADLPDGYVYGQGKRKQYIIKDIEKFREQKRKQCTGSGNPMYGHGERISGDKNGHSIYIYTYNGVDYYCRDDLMLVLKTDFPTISESAIRKIMKGSYTHRISNKYKYVIDNLTWRLKDKYENKIN